MNGVAVACAVAGLVLPLASCSGDDGSATTTSTDATVIVGDHSCDDPISDVYVASDPEAKPTARAPGIDLIYAEAILDGDELRVTFETVEPVLTVDFPELIVFGGAFDDPNRFQIRAVGSEKGWALRRVTFVDERPTDAPIDAQVNARGNSVTFTMRAGLFPVHEFVAFAFASTGSDDGVAVNDECFPFADRAPLG